jgi:glycosyltransferase involved in cell wall biosynthesis
MRILLLTTQIPFVYGGAEVLANSLRNEISAAGHDVEIVKLPFRWYPPEKILDNMLAWQLVDISEVNGKKVDLVIGLKFPAYLASCENKVLWLLHQHREAYDLWDHPIGDLGYYPDGRLVRDAIWDADKKAISEARKVFTISKNVSARLQKYSGIPSTPIYHPPQNESLFHCEEYGDYFFFPSRISRLKRQYLIVEALRYAKNPVKVYFAGVADNQKDLDDMKKLAAEYKISDRVKFLGFVNEEEKRKYYANCLGVIFIPVDEDYGYITLESMLSSKPVLTAKDSGGPLEFVLHEKTGFVFDPEPKEIARVLDRLWISKNEAKQMGKQGKTRYNDLNITWNNVLEALLK